MSDHEHVYEDVDVCDGVVVVRHLTVVVVS